MPEYPDSLVESLRAMSRLLIDGEVGDALQRIADLAVEAIEPADLAGITLQDEDGPRTAVFTDPRALEIDQAQYDTGIGPCLDAWRSNQVLRIESTADDARWERFSQVAHQHGVLSTLSLPLAFSDATAVGALNLYARRRSAFAKSDERHAAAFAEQLAVVVTTTRAPAAASALSPQMRQALASRAVVHKARSIVMGARSCTAEEAYQLLARAAQQSNSTLHDAARHVVQRAKRRAM